MTRHPFAENQAVGLLVTHDSSDFTIVNNRYPMCLTHKVVELFGNPNDAGPLRSVPE
jgi:hypothetical protein